VIYKKKYKMKYIKNYKIFETTHNSDYYIKKIIRKFIELDVTMISNDEIDGDWDLIFSDVEYGCLQRITKIYYDGKDILIDTNSDSDQGQYKYYPLHKLPKDIIEETYNKISSYDIYSVYCSAIYSEDLDSIKEVIDRVDITNSENKMEKNIFDISNDFDMAELINYLESYEFQHMFLTKYPQSANLLNEFKIDEKIKEEFNDILEASSIGFFDLKTK